MAERKKLSLSPFSPARVMLVITGSHIGGTEKVVTFLARRLDHGWLATTTGGGQPIGFDALGEQTRPLSEQPLALGRGLLAQRLVAFAAALEEGCGLLGTAEGHGRGRDELAQERDIVRVAEQLRDRARGIDSGCELRWPTRREQLHLPPMMLHAFPPLVEIFVVAGGESFGLRRFPTGLAPRDQTHQEGRDGGAEDQQRYRP